MSNVRHTRRHWFLALAGRVAAVLGLAALWQAAAVAQPGSIVFQDDLDTFNAWSSTVGSDGGVNTLTASSPTRSMFIRDNATVTSDPIDADVPAARLAMWIRRGSNSFSGFPETNENLVVEYENDAGTWVALETFLGGGSAGQIYTPSYDLPVEALHSALRIRLRMTAGSNSDYWHVDDVVITELAAAAPFAVGACESFESGMDGWNVLATGTAAAGVSTATASSPTSSLFTRSGAVTVTSNPISLAGQLVVKLDVWIRRGGSFAGSDRPEAADTLVLEYRTAAGGWSALETFAGIGSGGGGQTFDRSYDLPAAAVHADFRIQVRQTNGTSGDDYWHIDDLCLTPQLPISYSFDEPEWTGAADEVQDASANALHGTTSGGPTTADTTPARANSPGTCGYGVFDGSNDFIEVADDDALDLASEVTVAAWIRMRSVPAELHTIVSKDTNYEYHIDTQRRLYWWWNDASGNVRSLTTTTQIQLNQWYHVVVTYESGAQRMYINGAVQGVIGNFTGALATNNESLYIGADVNFFTERAFDGFIDEVRIIPRALTAGEVTALYTETHDCPAVAAQFTINHDGFGINCVAETITVNVVDADAGTPLLSYNAQVQLEARTFPGGALAGFGTWTRVTGTGAFSDGAANDGIATYNWPLGESQAVFTFSYTQGSTPLDIDVFQISDDGIRDNEAVPLAFSPNGFTVTAAALPPAPVPPIVSFAAAQTAGNTFPIHIAAYGQTPADPVCGIIEAYTGPKSLKFWSQYANPATGAVSVQIDGVDAAGAEGSAAVQSVAFTAGQATVTAKYKDVGLIRVLMKDDTVVNPAQLPTGIRGATANFVVKPFSFVLSNIRNGPNTLANPAANDANGGVFVAAGSPFRMTVTARDSEGTATPNYGRETIAEGVRLDAQIHAPAGGAAPAVGAAVGFGAFASGAATGTDFTWQEVGVMRVLPGVGDGDYLGAGDVTGTLSERIGRFVPSHFTVALNAPLFATACTAGGFTYLGQPFQFATAPMITATARSVSGALTQNYTGTFFKLATGTSQNRTYTATTGTLNAGVPAPGADPVVVATGPGIGTLTFGGGTGFSFAKGALQAPFTAEITLALDVRDADGVLAVGAGPLGNPVTFGAAGGIPFSTGAQLRHGRIRIGTAVGSELIDLAVPMVAEYYHSAGAGFIANGDDTCSGGVTLALPPIGFTENLDVGETCVRDSGAPGASGVGCAAAAPLPRYTEPPAAGDYGLRLAAPGAGNNGSVSITATVPNWLRHDWSTGTAGDEDPSGQATFGIFGGEAKQIYIREIY